MPSWTSKVSSRSSSARVVNRLGRNLAWEARDGDTKSEHKCTCRQIGHSEATWLLAQLTSPFQEETAQVSARATEAVRGTDVTISCHLLTITT